MLLYDPRGAGIYLRCGVTGNLDMRQIADGDDDGDGLSRVNESLHRRMKFMNLFTLVTIGNDMKIGLIWWGLLSNQQGAGLGHGRAGRRFRLFDSAPTRVRAL